MVNALREYQNGLGLNQCSRKYEIPKKTLLRHIRGEVKRGSNQENSSFNGRLTALSPVVENELVTHILRLESVLFGLTTKDVRKLAYDILNANDLQNPFNNGMAGKKWYYAFMKRHPELSLRQPECVSIARCKGFNRKNVYEFFDILEKIVDENKFDALTIYNVDESGFSTVQKKAPKVLALRGKHQVGTISSGERGVNTTLVACTNAAGNFVPPMIIFKRQRMHPSLANGAPAGSIVEVSDTGYINSDLFVKWLKLFIKHVKPSTESKVLILLDGHTTHSKNLEAINLARQNGIILLQLPGHTTHRLQPLDVSMFKPLQTYYDENVTRWLRSNPGRKVTQFEVTELLAEAYGRAATLANAANGFRSTGVWPVNRNVFSDADFQASENMLEKETNNGETAEPQVQQLEEPVPIEPEEDQRQNILQHGSILKVPVAELSPIPVGTQKHQKRKEKGAQKAQVLTLSPYKTELEIAKEKRTVTELKKNKKVIVKRKLLTEKKEKSVKKQKMVDKKGTSRNKGKMEEPGPSTSCTISLRESDWFCFLCNETRIEDMVQCEKCMQWSHETCAGYSTTEGERRFVCDLCDKEC